MRLPSPNIAVVSAVILFAASSLSFAETVEELTAKGDVHDQRFQPTEALQYYIPAEKAEPQNPGLLVRIARQYRHLMADASSKTEKLRLGNAALEYSKRAAAAGPSDSDAQLATGITLGKMLPLLSTREQVEASPQIKSSAEKAVSLNPRNDLAWHILGRWHRAIAEVSAVKRAIAPLIYGKLPSGSTEEAVRSLQRAVALNPNRLMHQVELGRAYAQMGKIAEAKRYLTRGLSMPNTDKDDPEVKERGREVLAKLR
jgi:tetratricopeptide (TPR) repeat protein